MASRIIHLAITDKLMQKHSFKNINRLKLGTILPDAAAPGHTTEDSHLKIKICGGTKKTYDLTRYRNQFGRLMLEDDLYLGFYLHLVQDILFRYFMYELHGWDSKTPGHVDRLHNDYALINSYVIRKYRISQDIRLPENLGQEALFQIYPFGIRDFLADMENDFLPYHQGEIFFFTEEMADTYIQMAADACDREIQALRAGKPGMDEYVRAWKNKPVSLLETTLNTRDLGGYRVPGNAYTRMDAVLRSDVQLYPSERDIACLQNHQITDIIDLRGEAAVCKAPSGFAHQAGFRYHHVPIDAGSGIPESLEAVPRSYMEIAADAHMPQVFRLIASAEGGVMVNCQAGKDRTGVVSALLLMLCGVSEDDLLYDYLLTKECSGERFRKIHQNFPELDMNIVIPHEKNMRRFLELFRERYQDIRRYFAEIGISDEERVRIRQKLCSLSRQEMEGNI